MSPQSARALQQPVTLSTTQMSTAHERALPMCHHLSTDIRSSIRGVFNIALWRSWHCWTATALEESATRSLRSSPRGDLACLDNDLVVKIDAWLWSRFERTYHDIGACRYALYHGGETQQRRHVALLGSRRAQLQLFFCHQP